MLISLPRLLGCACVLCLLAVAGCVDREPQQRAAFIAFLQARVLEAPGAWVRPPSGQDREALGEYADQYRVIGNFQHALESGMGELQQAVGALTLHSVGEVRARGEAFGRLRDRLARSRQAVALARAQADEARTALFQADDLKRVYGQAYQKAVIVPADTLLALYPILDAALTDARQAALYAQGHADQLRMDGVRTQVRDPTVQAEFNALLARLNNRSDAVDQVQGRLRALRPPAP